jgi:hypothetical protein
LFKGNDRERSLFAFSKAMARVLEEIPQAWLVEWFVYDRDVPIWK